MKIIITILLLLSTTASYSKAKDVNVYIEIIGNTIGFKPTIEYNINTFEFLGESQITYINFGASMMGVINGGMFYSSPVIGITQVIGDGAGVEFGANYFRQYKGDQDTDFDKVSSLYDLDSYDAIGFQVGYRECSETFLFRITYTPFYRFDTKELKTSFSMSFGWGF